MYIDAIVQNRSAICMFPVLFLLCMLAASRPAFGAEYFVGKHGNDANDGKARDKAFLTIQKGASAIQPGDILTIGPGEYAENIKIINFGSPGKDTVVRAEIPGTAILRGDVDAPEFTKVSGRNNAHVTDWDGPVLCVNEIDTFKTLKSAAGIDALDISPGSYFHDEAAKKLYISTSDFQRPEKHYYTICVRKDHGFHVNKSRRVVIEGLAASGFMSPTNNYVFLKAVSGFIVIDSKKVTVRNCTAYLNQAGITVHNGDNFEGEGNVVENCRAFGNHGDGIACYYPHNAIFRDCVSFLNGSFGINYYAKRMGEAIFLRNLSWGNLVMDFQMKGAGLSGDDIGALAENCIGLGTFNVFNQQHCIVGGKNYYRSGNHAKHPLPLREDNIGLPIVEVPEAGSSAPDVDACIRILDEFKDREFADPINFDFRLQSTSRFRHAVSNAPYSGPYPYKPDIYYVTAGGSDEADGLSMSNAWKTLARALKNIKDGDTLYLAGGHYTCDAALSVKNVKIRGRGLDIPVIDGQFSVAKSEGLLLERLQFAGDARLTDSRDIAIDNSVFAKASEAMDVNGLRITHSIMAAQLVLKGCSKVFISGDIFAASPGIKVDKPESIMYSSCNSYADQSACREAGGKKLSLAELQKDCEIRSRVIKPEIAVAEGVATVRNAHQFLGRGPLGTSIGLYREWSPLSVHVAGPKVHSTTETTANIEWWTSLPAHVAVVWGDTPECANSVELNQTDYFSYSLIGLQPGKKYFVKIKPLYASPEVDPAQRIRITDKTFAETSFTTAAKGSEPKNYFVSTNGSDSASGLSREAAWKTIQHAANTVRPGDTILLCSGEYTGRIFFPITGEKGRPITVKAVPGEKAVIVAGGFTLNGKHYYNIDSLYFKDCDAETPIKIKHGSNLQVTRCHRNVGWSSAISAVGTPDVLVKNCAFFPGIGAVEAERCPNLRIENNAIFGTMIGHILVQNAPDEPVYIVNNVFGEGTRGKQYAAAITVLQPAGMTESNNCFYWRWPEIERNFLEIWALPDKDRKVSSLFDVHTKEYFVRTLPEYRAIVRPTDSFAANPQMSGGGGTRQGWGPGFASNDFNALFSMSPELIKRGIGLQPEAFNDFHFRMGDWPYDAAWAEKIMKDKKAADTLLQAGKDEEAIAACTSLAKIPMHERLKSELLEQAAMCANRLKQYDRAIAIATNIPIKSLSARCQMRIMAENGKYSELLAKFADKPGAGTPLLTWQYPEQDDLLVDVYSYRAVAYAESNDFAKAEAELRVMLNAQTNIGMFSSPGIVDMAWAKLGDFYHKYQKDDAKAMAAYTNAITRSRANSYGVLTPKPVLLGNTETLASATRSASEILRSQGKETEALKLQVSLLMAQGNALGILDNKAGAMEKFKEALKVKGITDEDREECEKKIKALQGEGK
ncbi:MAG: right-handed parallel beta-helix repeat-containing protein [Kiritimatiellia bacterium]